MPIQPPHHVSSLPFRFSGLFRIPTKFIPACRGTQFTAPSVSCRPGAPTKDAKRTQLPQVSDFPTTQRHETNPIPTYQVSHRPLFLRNEPHLPRPKCETNPISTPNHPAAHQKCETNPIHHPASFTPPPFLRNEPNSPYRWRLASLPSPDYAKRTQSVRPPHAVLPLCETNPISTYPASRRPLFQRNEPNLPHHLQSTIYNIQSPGPIYPTIYSPQYTIYNIQYKIPWPNLPFHRHNPFEHPLGARVGNGPCSFPGFGYNAGRVMRGKCALRRRPYSL